MEIGVGWGDFTSQILEVAQPSQLHLIDPWWLINDRGEWSWEIAGRRSAVDAFASVVLKFRSFLIAQTMHLHIGQGHGVLETLPDSYFDWAYLDSSHEYRETKQELEILVRKVKPDGVIAGHDWQPDRTHRHHGVYAAVNELLAGSDFALIATDQHTQWAIARRR